MAQIDSQYLYALKQSFAAFKQYMELDVVNDETWASWHRACGTIMANIGSQNARDFAGTLLTVLDVELQGWWYKRGFETPDCNCEWFTRHTDSDPVVLRFDD